MTTEERWSFRGLCLSIGKFGFVTGSTIALLNGFGILPTFQLGVAILSFGILMAVIPAPITWIINLFNKKIKQ